MSYEQPTPAECVHHPGYPAAGYCSQCGQPVCEACFQRHGEVRLCPVCAASAPRPAPNTTLVVLGIIAGVLFVCLVVLLVVMGGRSRTPQPLPPPPGLARQLPPGMGMTPGLAPGEALPAPGAGAGPVTPPKPTPPAGEQALLRAALEGKPGWVGVVKWHATDWSEARVSLGPSKSNLQLSRALWWNPDQQRYEIMDEGPAEGTGGSSPQTGPKPSQDTAEGAVLEQETAGWMVKVITHSPDWRQVTLYSGPSASEWVYQYRLHWDDKLAGYVTDHAGPVDGSASPPPGE